MSTNIIVPFDSISENQLSQLGGKGANLVALTNAGFPVPPGFCVTTVGYQLFMDRHAHSAEIFSILDTLTTNRLDEIEKVGKRIRQLLMSGDMPETIQSEIENALHNFSPDARFAVRSSATAEDLPDASFAGQQDTYLNIIGEKAVIEHVKKCWVSLFTDRAISYRMQQEFDHHEVKLSVIVQEMVASEVSGILFSANPITSNRAEMVINAGFGLGEALVSGIITPDTYVVNKKDTGSIHVDIGGKHAAIQYAAKGGTELITLSSDQQSAQALNKADIQRLAELGKQIEAHYGEPQDIEWAKVKDTFYILQSRPITTLYPIPVNLKKDGKEHIYASFGHLQMMTGTISPMGMSLIRLIMPFHKESRDVQFSTLISPAGGRIYFDASELIQNPIAYHNFHTVMGQVDLLMRSAMDKLANMNQKPVLKDILRLRFVLRWAFPVVGGAMLNLFFSDPHKKVTAIKLRMESWIDHYQQYIRNCDTLAAKLDPINGFRNTKLIRTIINFPPGIFPGIIAQQLIPRLLPDKDITLELQVIQRSIYDNITTEMDLQIGDLADLIKQDEKQRQQLLAMNNGDAINAVLQYLEGSNIKPVWDAFLEKFGHRGPGEIDLQQPRWRENKSGVANMIMNNLSTPEIGAHRRHIESIHQEGDLAAERILAFARQKPFGNIRAKLIHRMVLWIRYGLGIRENPKYYLIKIMGFVKEILLSQADQWVNQGVLESRDDIFWLSLEDVLQAVKESAPALQEKVTETKKKYKQYAKLVPPRIITSSGEIPPVDYNRDDLPDGALPGNPVSAGETVGIARVILDPHKETIQAGEILIAPFTDPGWTPLFVHASGLVMELGGGMTHGSVVAREYGIPAVAGVINATQLIKSGMKIRVDGNKGFVEVLDE